MVKNNISIHLNFEDVDEKDIFIKLDLVISFMLQNKLNGSVVLNRSEIVYDEEE